MTELEINRRVWVKTEFIGWHRWPDAPDERTYLSLPHRHLFKVLASIEVEHGDREIEFHDLLDVVRKVCSSFEGRMIPTANAPVSCEHIAEDVVYVILGRWPDRNVTVSVSEDGEVGATVDVA